VSDLDSVAGLGASGLGTGALGVEVELVAGLREPKPVKAANRGA
jgi:hypothetical protein